MDAFLERFAERLSDLGVTAGLGSAVPAGPGVQKTTVRLTRGTSARAYRLLYGQAVSLPDAGLARGVEPPTLVFTSFMTPRSAEAFRRAGVQYLDLVGNAWVQFDGVLLDVRVAPVLMIWPCPHIGRPATCSARPAHRWPRAPGLAAAVGGDQQGPGPRRRRLARAGAQCAGLADRSGVPA